MDIRFLGHACFTLSDGDTTVLIDPFLTGNPKAAASADEVEATTILLTHGHEDHFGDTVAIAKRTGAPVVAITELAGEMGEEGVEVRDCNLGGTATFDWGWVKLVPAWHTSTTPKGTVNTPAGLLINFEDTIVYHLGDTCLFSDLQLVGKRHPIDIALMCIGGHYTMDRHDAVDAAELRRRQDGDPLPLRHLPADRDRRRRRSSPTSSRPRRRGSSSSSPARPTRHDPRDRSHPGRGHRRWPRSAASWPTSRASPRPTRSPASGTSWRSCGCASRTSSRRW